MLSLRTWIVVKVTTLLWPIARRVWTYEVDAEFLRGVAFGLDWKHELDQAAEDADELPDTGVDLYG